MNRLDRTRIAAAAACTPTPSRGRASAWPPAGALAFAVAVVLTLATLGPGAKAAPDERRAERGERSERQDRPDARGDLRPETRPDRRATPPPPPPDRRAVPVDRWYDGAHGHNRTYPPPGRVVPLPPHPHPGIWWGGVSYRFWDGIWVTGGSRGWVTVRPPIGIVITDLPDFRTALVIGGLTYYYVNGVYYRDHLGGGFEVVAPPVATPEAPASATDKTFVYPRQGQSAQQQASDEYECHRWAVAQTGFDPTGAATGQATNGSPTARSDYQRARSACLEGRGYTVR